MGAVTGQAASWLPSVPLSSPDTSKQSGGSQCQICVS